MTETMELMNARELAKFIEEMEDNTYISLASESHPIVGDDEKIVDYECTGWWSIVKLNCADQKTLLFNYFGGGYPYAYSIDEEFENENIQNAVERFFEDCLDFGTLEEYFVVDKKPCKIGKDDNKSKEEQKFDVDK